MKNNVSDFLRFAYEHNRIKDIKEAFDEYPVEEEWHEGKIENVIKEDEEKTE